MSSSGFHHRDNVSPYVQGNGGTAELWIRRKDPESFAVDLVMFYTRVLQTRRKAVERMGPPRRSSSQV